MGEGKYFGAISEGNGTFTWAVEAIEEVDEKGNGAEMATRGRWDVKGEAGS